MLPILQIGPLSMQTAGLVLLLALWVGLSVAERLAPRYNITANQIYNLVFAGLLSGVLGARFGYTLRSPSAFASDPLSIFSPNPAMLDMSAGLLTAVIIMMIYAQRRQYPLWATLDALTPLFAIMAFGISCAHFASGNAFGTETNLPWGIHLWGAERHPTQVYGMITTSLIFLATFPWRNYPIREPGSAFLTFMALSAVTGLFLEAFRGDSHLIFGNIRSAQIAAWIVLAASLWLLRNRISLTEDTHGSNTD